MPVPKNERISLVQVVQVEDGMKVWDVLPLRTSLTPFSCPASQGDGETTMKKLMLAAAALAACAAMADGEISSANVVGYNTITIRPEWNMFSVRIYASWP